MTLAFALFVYRLANQQCICFH